VRDGEFVTKGYEINEAALPIYRIDVEEGKQCYIFMVGILDV
jgi:hypothetical protein